MSSAEIRCPCCANPLDTGTAVCPRCGLEGLDQIFLSKPTYLQWRREVLEPYKASCRPPIRLFGGKYHALILRRNRLYGIGSNSSGQLGDFDTEEVTAPRLIARDVKTAAAGVHYSIYMTQSGAVKVLGRGKYADRPIKISNAAEVYMTYDTMAGKTLETFWIRDSNGKLFGFGDNDCIEKKMTECLYEYPKKSFDCTCDTLVSCSTGPPSAREYRSYCPIISKLHSKYTSTDIYKQFEKRCSDRHIYWVPGVQKREGPDFSGGSCTTYRAHCHVVVVPKIMRSNEYIYAPVEAQDFRGSAVNLPGICYGEGGWLWPIPDLLQEKAYRKIWFSNIPSIRRKTLEPGTIFALDTEGTLLVYKEVECNLVLVGSIPCVYDIAGCDAEVLISTMDGCLMRSRSIDSLLRSGGTEALEELPIPEEE